MADPTDPQTAALANIQNAGRTYNRGRRRGAQANTDPAFTAAVETTDPAARREALAQYARSRASELFPGGAQTPPNGRDVVNQAFPQGDAFAPVQQAAAPLPSQADVMSQVSGEAAPARAPYSPGASRKAVPMMRDMAMQVQGAVPAPSSPRMDEAEAKMIEEANTMGDNIAYAGATDEYQDSAGMPGPEDSPETHQWLMERGRKLMQGTPDPRDPSVPAQQRVEEGYDEAAFDAAQGDGPPRNWLRTPVQNTITARRGR